MLDGRSTPALLLQRDTVVEGGVKTDLNNLLLNQSYDRRGPFVTFETFDRWWNARKGKKSMNVVLLEQKLKFQRNQKIEIEKMEQQNALQNIVGKSRNGERSGGRSESKSEEAKQKEETDIEMEEKEISVGKIVTRSKSVHDEDFIYDDDHELQRVSFHFPLEE